MVSSSLLSKVGSWPNTDLSKYSFSTLNGRPNSDARSGLYVFVETEAFAFHRTREAVPDGGVNNWIPTSPLAYSDWFICDFPRLALAQDLEVNHLISLGAGL